MIRETSELHVSLRSEPDAVWITCAGAIDLATAVQVDDAVAHALGVNEGRIRIDMSNVDFFGSDGIRCLLRAHELCERAGVELVVDASGPVLRVLEVSGVKQRLRLS